jgi:DNA-directed RNA polymerase II subunit RPB3
MSLMSRFSAIKKKNSKIEFTITNVDTAYVNAFRRIILSEIPNAAFYFDAYDIEHNDINVITNTGILHNEFIAHRISLVPLHFEPEDFEHLNNYRFVLHVKNTGRNVINVTTADFEIYYNDEKVVDKERILPKNDFTKDYILLTKLKPNLHDVQNGQELHVECVPSLGIGKNHARWSPVSQCCFYNAVDDVVAEEAFKKEPPGTDRKNFDTLQRFKYFKKNKYDEPSEFIFTIESVARLTPEYLFEKSMHVLSEKLDKFAADIIVQGIGNIKNMYQIVIKDEDHTLLNVLQSAIYNEKIREKRELVYIGYYQPHPLDNVLYLKIKFPEELDQVDMEYVKKYMVERVENIKAQIAKLIKEWTAAM